MKLATAITAILLAGLLAACAGQPAPEIDEDELAQAVKAVREELDAAMQAEDVEAYLSFFMEDAVWMPPNAPEFIGKDTARQKIESFFKQVDVDGGSEVYEQVVMGPNWIGERGHFSILLSPKDGEGEPVHSVGSYLTLWTKDVDGKWKIACDMWNSDRGVPVAGAGGAM